MEEKVLIELTAAEVLMLQELAGQAGDRAVEAWKRKPLEGLARKAAEAYQKPRMGAADHAQKIREEKEYWEKKSAPGNLLPELMAHSRDMELRFFYEVEA